MKNRNKVDVKEIVRRRMADIEARVKDSSARIKRKDLSAVVNSSASLMTIARSISGDDAVHKIVERLLEKLKSS